MRQRGGGHGLGGLFTIFARSLLPIIKSQVRKIAPKIAPKLTTAGVGLISDLVRKKNLKQAVKKRGIELISDSINTATSPANLQSLKRKRKGRVKRQPNVNRKKVRTIKRNKDIFD